MLATSENAGHTHTINNKESGYTDMTNNHRHKLSTGCSRCDKVRKTVFRGKMMTSFNNGHSHFFEPSQL